MSEPPKSPGKAKRPGAPPAPPSLSTLSAIAGLVFSGLSLVSLVLYLLQKRITSSNRRPPDVRQPVGPHAAKLEVSAAAKPDFEHTPPDEDALASPPIPVAPASFTPPTSQPSHPVRLLGWGALALCAVLTFGGLTIFSLADWFGWELSALLPLQAVSCLWPVFCRLDFPPFASIAFLALLTAVLCLGLWVALSRTPVAISDLPQAETRLPRWSRLRTPINLLALVAFLAAQSYVVVQAVRDEQIHPAVWLAGLALLIYLAWRVAGDDARVHSLWQTPAASAVSLLLGTAALLVAIGGIVSRRPAVSALAIGLCALLLWHAVGRNWQGWRWPNRLERLGLIVVTVASFLLLSYGLNSWAWAFWGDEYSFYDLARQFAEGRMKEELLSGAGVYGYHPVLSSVWQGLSMWLFGATGYGWRVSHSLALALSIPLFYYFLRPLIGRGYAFIAVSLYGSAHTLLSFGKLGSNNAQAIAVLALCLAAFAWAARAGSLTGFVVTGICVGLGFYTFGIARLFSLVIAFWLMLYYFPFDFRRWRPSAQNLAVWLTVVVSAILTALPPLSTRSAWEGQLRNTVVTSEVAFTFADKLAQLIRNSIYSLTAWLYHSQEAVSVAGPHADPVTAALMVIGFAGLLATWRRGWRIRLALLGSWGLTAVLMGGIQQYYYPSITRLFAVVPFYAMLAAVGVLTLSAVVSTTANLRQPAVLWIPAGLAAVAIAGLNFWISADLSQQRVQQKVPAFYLHTAQISADAQGNGPHIYLVAPPSGEFWFKLIYEVHEIPLTRASLILPRSAAAADGPICRSADWPAIVMIETQLAEAPSLAREIEQCWPGADVKLIKDILGTSAIYRIINQSALGSIHSVPGYWIEEEPPRAVVSAPASERERWIVYQPRGMGLGPNGELAVVETVSQSILVFDSDGNIINEYAGLFTYPSDVAFASDGQLIVADAAVGILWVADDGVITRQVGGVSSPRGVAVAPDGTIYVANTGGQQVVHLTAEGDRIGVYTGGGAFEQPTSVAVGPDGLLAVGDPVASRIFIVDETDTVLTEIAIGKGETSDSKPGIAWLADGSLAYTDPLAGKVIVADMAGVTLREYDGFKRPNDVVIDSDGNLLVEEGGGDRISMIELGGA